MSDWHAPKPELILVSNTTMHPAKQGFYQNHPRKHLGSSDFCEATKLTQRQHDHYITFGYTHVSTEVYERLVILKDNPKYFYALFKMLDAQGEG